MAFSSIQHVIPLFMRIQPKKQQNIQNAKTRKHISTTTEDLYKNRSNGDKVFIDIPGAKGIEVFIITGPELLDVVKNIIFSPVEAVSPQCGDSDSNTV